MACRLKQLGGIWLASLLSCAAVYGTPITFRFDGTGSGSLNGTPFSIRSFSIVLTGDTVNQPAPGGGYFPFSAASVEVSGILDSVITNSEQAFVVTSNPSPQIFLYSTSPTGFFTSSPSLVSWDWVSPLPPITFFSFGPSPIGPTFQTLVGELVFSRTDVLGELTIETVPEPMTRWTVGCAMFILGLAVRRARNRQPDGGTD